MSDFDSYMQLSEGSSNHITVGRGSYTDYLNAGHRKLIEDINSLFTNVPVIGADITISLKSNALKEYYDDNIAEFVISKDLNPSFVSQFYANVQRFSFSMDDSGRPGLVSAKGVSYEKGYFDIYMTKSYYGDNGGHPTYQVFNGVLSVLCQSQYTSCTGREFGSYESGSGTSYLPSKRHRGNLLSIVVPQTTMTLYFGNDVYARYHNVKFDDPVLTSGALLQNDTVKLKISFSYSYISFDRG